jgi:hypothetical protein
VLGTNFKGVRNMLRKFLVGKILNKLSKEGLEKARKGFNGFEDHFSNAFNRKKG